MAIKEDIERSNNDNISCSHEEVTVALLPAEEKNMAADEEDGQTDSSKASLWMVYLSTFVAVCGSFEFGSCAGYSSPTQNAIREDLSLTLAEAMRTATIFCVAGWLAIYFAQGALALDIGRLATGYGMGVFSYVLMICTGVSVAFIIGTVLAWRTLALTGLVPCAILLFGLFFIPESPRWLAKIGREKEFEAALQKLRGKDADISNEADEIRIGVGLMVVQQFGGINGICFYVSNIFESAGFSATIGTIIYAILQVVITGLNTTVIDKGGRKPLLLVSSTGLILGCILTGTSFYLKIYISSFSAGMGAVPWVVMSEIFPINIKGVAGSLATLVNWFGAWAVSYTFNFLMDWSSYGTFILYAAINALGILFIVTVVPETKGKTLEQIQAAINA
ncbi:General substrate transporter [Corchorus olitorius]|uniref:General substrate transporter n=1 Tax=Corchorus olitorius TaxID=93759 RepID=A0A1R3KD20_9ROSI|nr:General substrate transporter [Corchorus olitorius]